MAMPQTVPPRIEWRRGDRGILGPVLIEGTRERDIVWAPQPGAQEAFLTCPIYEILLFGNRGGGKTDALIFKYLQHVNQGYGAAWRGIIFRRTFPELADIIERCKKWIPRIFPGAVYNEGKHVWTFPQGEKLSLSYFRKSEDYWAYHGHEYPFIAWEELTTWPDDSCYVRMFSCARSTVPGMPAYVVATTNAYGVGHNWVKRRFRLPILPGRMAGAIIYDSKDREGELEPPRVAIKSDLMENMVLLNATPREVYVQRLRASARNKSELRAWLYDDWNIVAGGMIDDIWAPVVHVVPNVPPHLIPKQWRLDRSYDHGQGRPFSVGWWAESNGEPFRHNGRLYGPKPGDLYRFAEWYGWQQDRPNEGLRMLSVDIARGINERETDWGIYGRVDAGPADTQIFDDYEPGKSVAGDMLSKGVYWEHADKGPNSRMQGWQQIRKMLQMSLDPMREEPGMFVMERCHDGFIRTVPVLPRSHKNIDDVDTESEDHVGDEVRYRTRRKERSAESGAM